MSSNLFFKLAVVALILVNLFALYRIRVLNDRVVSLNTQYDYKLNSEKSFHEFFENSFNLTGDKLLISNMPLAENLSHNNINPVLVINKKICQTCKDKLFIDMDKLKEDNLNLFDHLNIILVDETSESIGSAMENFYQEHSCSLSFIDNKDISIFGGDRLPDIFIALVNDNLQIISSCEFDINKPNLFSVYARTLNQKIDI